MSWASIVKSEPQVVSTQDTCMDHKTSVGVIDANAVIQRSGLMNLKQTVDRVVTVPEVLREVKDAQSRQAMATLPFEIETEEPSEESLRAVVAFARATGDLHALSSVDMRLIALARTLEVRYYGDQHLRKEPKVAVLSKKPAVDTKMLPGWGVQGGDWAEIDRMNAEEEAKAASLLTGNGDEKIDDPESRISTRVQELTLEDGEENLDIVEGHEGSSLDDEEDGEWETAYKNRNKARRIKRKEIKKQMREEKQNEEEEEEEEDGDEEQCSEVDAEENIEDDLEMMGQDDPQQMEAHPADKSAIISMTADFAMQNVILQMGLRLAAPDGRQISSVSRWVLRCTACGQVTKEVGRLFCPRCGNATLDRVKINVSPDGSEQVGIRKKHILRGTRYSLPKPKGGRHHDPILREDQLLTKKHLLRSKKAAAKANELDPFAPEYTDETWHQVAAVAAGPSSMATLLNSGWKKNPNERKHVATNRRRK